MSLDSFGSDLIREGACKLIGCLAQTNVLSSLQELERSETIENFWTVINTTLSRPEEFLLPVASKALGHLLSCSSISLSDDMYHKYLSNLDVKKDKHTKRGFGMAFGYIPKHYLLQNIELITESLISAALVQSIASNNDAEARRNAFQSLIKVIEAIKEHISNSNPIFLRVFEKFGSACILGMSDYSFDSRGDVGSWIRNASMHGIKLVLTIAIKIPIADSIREDMIGFLVLSCLEKIDRIRETAGNILCGLLEDPQVLINERKALEKALRRYQSGLI